MFVLSQSRTDYLGRYTPLAASNGKHDPLPSRMVEVRKLASSDKGERHIGGNPIGSRLGLGCGGLRKKYGKVCLGCWSCPALLEGCPLAF